MSINRRFLFALAIPVAFTLTGVAHAQDSARCDRAKLKLAAQYAKCLLKAEASIADGGDEQALADCDGRLTEKWVSVEDRGGDSCATGIDLHFLQSTLQQCTGEVARGTGREYEIVFGIDDPVVLTSVAFDVHYENAPGEFPGEVNNVSCVALVSEGLSAFNDQGTTRTLRAGLIAYEGFPVGPIPLVACRFLSSGWQAPEAHDFQIVLVTANTTGLEEIVPSPVISVHSITELN